MRMKSFLQILNTRAQTFSRVIDRFARAITPTRPSFLYIWVHDDLYRFFVQGKINNICKNNISENNFTNKKYEPRFHSRKSEPESNQQSSSHFALVLNSSQNQAEQTHFNILKKGGRAGWKKVSGQAYR